MSKHESDETALRDLLRAGDPAGMLPRASDAQNTQNRNRLLVRCALADTPPPRSKKRRQRLIFGVAVFVGAALVLLLRTSAPRQQPGVVPASVAASVAAPRDRVPLAVKAPKKAPTTVMTAAPTSVAPRSRRMAHRQIATGSLRPVARAKHATSILPPSPVAVSVVVHKMPPAVALPAVMPPAVMPTAVAPPPTRHIVIEDDGGAVAASSPRKIIIIARADSKSPEENP